MKCISPISIKDPKGTSNASRITVPCGKCAACLQTRRSQWSFRLNQELKAAFTAAFITLSYTDETVPVTEHGELTLLKSDLQLFQKRLRHHAIKHCKKANVDFIPIRYYSVGEYGTITMRPHYHAIIFNLPSQSIEEIPLTWNKGLTHTGTVNEASIHYTTKYLINDTNDDYQHRQKPFSLMSTKPPLGMNYLDNNAHWHTNSGRDYVLLNGIKQKIPRIYRDRLFGKFTKQILNKKAENDGYKSELEQDEKAIRLGNDPDKYRRERIENYRRIIYKSSKKNDKL